MWKMAPREARSGAGYKRGSPANVSDDWPTCSITVDWNPRRLCGTAHRNGAMSTKWLVYGAASLCDSCTRPSLKAHTFIFQNRRISYDNSTSLLHEAHRTSTDSSRVDGSP